MRKIEKKPRLLGIDLCRGLAAFAVIVVHSGDETWGVPVSYWASQFRTLFYFAVPFFLAVSFFFMTRNVSENIYWKFIKTKCQRILIPYVVWSIFYLCFGAVFFSITHQSDRLNNLWQDPLAIIFLGGASYHLYFLPLLFSGTLLVPLINSLFSRKHGVKLVATLFILSMIVNQLIAWSGNSFRLNPPLAFPSLLNLVHSNQVIYQIVRFLLIQFAWMLSCLPYICLAIILNHLILKIPKYLLNNKSLLTLLFVVFAGVNIFRDNFPFNELSTVTVAFSLLLFGILSSSFIRNNNFIISLGNCSFGIYLIHPILKRIITTVLTFTFPQLAYQVTITSIMCFSVSTFLLSWLLISILMQKKQLSRYIFGN